MATKIDRLGETRMMNYGMEALEKYYQEYLMGYARDSNFEGYDLGEQLTKDRIEKILEASYMEDDDAEFIKSISHQKSTLPSQVGGEFSVTGS